MVFSTGPDEFIVVGKDDVLAFTPLKADPNQALADVEYQEEGTYVNGEWLTPVRLNGDEGSGGRRLGVVAPKHTKVCPLHLQKNATGANRIVPSKFYHY